GRVEHLATQPPPGIRQLIVLDGSWRQSRRLLAANPWLAGLPRVSLPEQPSRYALRRAHRPGQLSTLEAGLHALALLEGQPQRFEPLWAAFDDFVRTGLARRGEPGFA
ncbi:DTW domain-containing protein, partial [Pelomonas sp. HMWF004]